MANVRHDLNVKQKFQEQKPALEEGACHVNALKEKIKNLNLLIEKIENDKNPEYKEFIKTLESTKRKWNNKVSKYNQLIEFFRIYDINQGTVKKGMFGGLPKEFTDNKKDLIKEWNELIPLLASTDKNEIDKVCKTIDRDYEIMKQKQKTATNTTLSEAGLSEQAAMSLATGNELAAPIVPVAMHPHAAPGVNLEQGDREASSHSPRAGAGRA